MALDVEKQTLYFGFRDLSNLVKFDLAGNTVSSLSLESYSGRGMAVDPLIRDLYYPGALNTVRRQALDDAADNEEILDQDSPSFSRSAAILLVPVD